MPSPEEIARRKALKQAMREAEREQIRSSLPLLPEQMRNLFDFVDRRLSDSECDGTLTITQDFLSRHQLPVDLVLGWLANAGGHCDCEVLANAEEKFLSAYPEGNA